MFVIARNELYRHFRKGRTGLQADDLGSRSVVDLGAGASSVLAARQEHALLLRALRQIPVDLQIALELFYWEGMSTGEIAQVLDIPQGTAKSRLRRAREALDAQMRELADDPQTLASTLASFDRWAAEVRNIVSPSQ